MRKNLADYIEEIMSDIFRKHCDKLTPELRQLLVTKENKENPERVGDLKRRFFEWYGEEYD